jgi:multicomponent Na+:H+ antiporter subunit A
MAGMPLSFGSVVKDIIGDVKSADDVFAFARAANTVFGAIAVAVAGVAAIRVFWRHPGSNETPDAHEGGPALVAPPLLLALTGIVLGAFPFFAQELIAQASGAMTPDTAAVAVSLSLEIGPALGSLAVTLAIGAAVFLLWDPLHVRFEWAARRIGRVGMASQFERSLRGIPRLAAASTRALQTGRLPAYVALATATLGAAMAAALAAGAAQGGLAWPAWDAPSAGVVGAALLICGGALAACVLRDRLVLLLAAGLVGYGSALLFLFTGAPDVAYTQFTVETVFVIVVAAVLLKLKRMGLASSVPEPALRPMALALSVLLASVIALLLLVATAGAFDSALSDFFNANSVPAAYGRNVVNVILVDYRALDTLGEITVVMLSLLAAIPLLQALRTGHAGAAR